ncbi:MAG: hypothetical protein WCQ00_02770 [bacterium]
MKKINQYKHIIVIVSALVILAGVLYWSQVQPTKAPVVSETQKGTVDPAKIEGAIKNLEVENPPVIGKNPTEEEIFNSPYIKQIRTALNGYLDGTNNGLEVEALENISKDMNCGLNNFSKKYYQSKFVILDASDNDYGGVQADISFIDNPDTVFFVWIYGEVGQQKLRAICGKAVSTKTVSDIVNETIKNSTHNL